MKRKFWKFRPPLIVAAEKGLKMFGFSGRGGDGYFFWGYEDVDDGGLSHVGVSHHSHGHVIGVEAHFVCPTLPHQQLELRSVINIPTILR